MMDSFRKDIDHDDAVSHDAPGIEPPPMIGEDERRMHVRAYNFWAKMLDGRSFPPIEGLDVDQLGDFGPHAVLLDFTSGIENPAIAYIGDTIAAECELDESIQYINDVPRRSLLTRLTDHYLQIIANRAPIGFEAEFVNVRGVTILYRGVLLPFSSDDDTIDFIMGVINWKEAADPDLSSAIADEMMLAASQAHPVSRPTVPVWADGPDALGAANDSFDEQDAHADEEEDTLDLAHADALSDDASLADRLATARDCAEVAAQSHARTHTALYRAIAQAWAFAEAAKQEPGDYADLLEEAGIAVSARAPMTPVVKLVFGAQHDKTRLAEYAAVLTHADQQAITPAALPAYLSGYQGGLKGLLRDVRAKARAHAPAKDPMAGVTDALRQAPALAVFDADMVEGADEFVIFVGRREADGSMSIVAATAGDHPAAQRLMRAAVQHQQG